MCIGAAIGAVFGAVTYVATTVASGREFNATDLAVSTAVGAVGGFLIGTGVGATAGVAALASVGAGAGVLSAQVGYSIASGTGFDSGELVIASAVGGVAGAAKGALAATGAGETTANTFIDGAAGAVQYAATEMYHGRPMDLDLAVESGSVGLVSAGVLGLVSEGFSAFSSQNNNQMWISVAGNNHNWLSPSTTKHLAQGALLEEAVSETFVSAVSETINNYTNDYLLRSNTANKFSIFLKLAR
jgi:hypothetical protein